MNPQVLPVPKLRAERGSAARFVLVPALFVAAYFGARAGIENVEPGSTAALLFALLPVPAFAGFIYGYIRMVRGMDEREKRVQLEALALAFPVALLVVFSAGLLDLAGFHGEQNWDLPRLWPLLLLPYWGGLALARRRYT